MHELIITSPRGSVLARLDLCGKRCVTLGRSQANDLVIDEPMVSRRHAEMIPLDDAGERWEIRDVGSQHGLWVDGKRVRAAAITQANTVKLGPARLTFADIGQRIGEELEKWLDDHADPAPAGPGETAGGTTLGAQTASAEPITAPAAVHVCGIKPAGDAATPNHAADRATTEDRQPRLRIFGIGIGVGRRNKVA